MTVRPRTGRPQASRPPRSLAVLISTYKRPDALPHCLDALARQTRPPDEVLVVVRWDDAETHAVLAARPDDGLRWRLVPVHVPGLVPSRNAALEACRADIAAFCDDDTRPDPDWVARIMAHFAADPELGGLGGRDHVHDGERFDEGTRDVVGHMQWFGRPIGNHHLGHGAPREVDFLKGANMSFRMEAVGALRFDSRLRGRNTQAHEDFGFSLAVHRSGWKVLYDPAVRLEHHAYRAGAPRPYIAGGGLPDPQGYWDTAHNFVLVLCDELPPLRRAAFMAWSLLMGSRLYPGLLQLPRVMLREGAAAGRKFSLYQHASFTVYAEHARHWWRTQGQAGGQAGRQTGRQAGRQAEPAPAPVATDSAHEKVG